MINDNEATTPVQKEETTSSDKEAITSTNSEEEVPSDKKVVELQGQVDDLTKQVEQSKNLQRQADKKARVEVIERKRIEDKLKKIQSGEVDEYEESVDTSSVDKEIVLKAKADIMGLVFDNPKYQELLKKDMTLKEVLRNNPFALIGDYLDTEDAVEQIKDLLDTRVSSLETEKVSAQPKEDVEKGDGKVFEAGAVQPTDEQASVEKETEPTNSDDKIEKSIRDKISFK